MSSEQLNTLKFHLERLPHCPDEEREHDWIRIAAAVDAFLAQTPEPANVRLRKMLLQFQPCVTQRRLPENYVPLLRELQAVLRARAGASKARAPAPSPVAEVAALLRGRALLVIGGGRRPDHAANMREAFELSEVVWPITSESNPSLDALEPQIARPDVAAVLLLIRWIRHALNDIAVLCERHRKPLVRIPGGYNVNQIAQQILDQRGRKLADGA